MARRKRHKSKGLVDCQGLAFSNPSQLELEVLQATATTGVGEDYPTKGHEEECLPLTSFKAKRLHLKLKWPQTPRGFESVRGRRRQPDWRQHQGHYKQANSGADSDLFLSTEELLGQSKSAGIVSENIKEYASLYSSGLIVLRQEIPWNRHTEVHADRNWTNPVLHQSPQQRGLDSQDIGGQNNRSQAVAGAIAGAGKDLM
ncbi:hypothetical protein DFH08DRAFT_826582 [Mycena albidolilacea]|uniref:Uncharacterized protein n=1 Tax=Mycena albidolilacea TaxID=1033008 RepID=A0AAD7E7Z7_9AGAR|nr:hypothetical protein DFH08DRAFT_826582 [Mycena albidolilacea]